MGGALIAAQRLAASGLAIPARSLGIAATGGVLHRFAWSLRLAGSVALAGAVMAASLLPSRPSLAVSDPDRVGVG